MHPHGHVVKIADAVVGVARRAGAGGAIAVAEARAQDEVQPPLRLLRQPQIQRRILLTARRRLKEGLHGLGGLCRLLRDVARVVPAAGEAELFAPVFGQRVQMAGLMPPGDREAAALAEEEVDHLPDALARKLPLDGEDAAAKARRLQHIASGAGKGAEVQLPKASALVLDRLRRRGEDARAALRVQQAKAFGRGGGHGRFSALGEIARGGQQELPGGSLPAVLVLGPLDRFEADVPELVAQMLRLARVAAAAEHIEDEIADGVARHGGKLPDALVPHAALQIEDRRALTPVAVGKGDLAAVFHGRVQVRDARALDLRADFKAQAVIAAPVLRRKAQVQPRGTVVGIVSVARRALRPALGAQGRRYGQYAGLLRQRGRAAGRGAYKAALRRIEEPFGEDLFLHKSRFQRALPVQRQRAVDIQALAQLALQFCVHLFFPFPWSGPDRGMFALGLANLPFRLYTYTKI